MCIYTYAYVYVYIYIYTYTHMSVWCVTDRRPEHMFCFIWLQQMSANSAGHNFTVIHTKAP